MTWREGAGLVDRARRALPPIMWTVCAEPADIPDAVALLRDYFAELTVRYSHRETTEEEIDETLDAFPSTGLALFLVLRADGAPAGCLGLYPTGEVTRVYVAPRFRRGGGARTLRVGSARRAGTARARRAHAGAGAAAARDRSRRAPARRSPAGGSGRCDRRPGRRQRRADHERPRPRSRSRSSPGARGTARDRAGPRRQHGSLLDRGAPSIFRPSQNPPATATRCSPAGPSPT